MKILLLDEDHVIIEQLKHLVHLGNNWQILTSHYLNYDDIDLVIIDTFNESYNKIFQKILTINPQIRTITVSDQLKSNHPKGCEDCTSNYNRVRLLKPIQIKDLFQTIDKFDTIDRCSLIDSFKTLDNIIPLIVNRFKNLFYDERLRLISSKTLDTESKEHTMQIVALLALLEQNKIDYRVLDENSIKIIL